MNPIDLLNFFSCGDILQLASRMKKPHFRLNFDLNQFFGLEILVDSNSAPFFDSKTTTWQFFVTFLGRLSDPFKG